MEKVYTLSDDSLQEELLSIFAVGLLECMKQNLIDSERAEQWLFSPTIAYSSRMKKFSKKFIYAMHYASELDACRAFDERRTTTCYQTGISNCEQLFLDALKSVSKPTQRKGSIRGSWFIKDLL